MANTRQASHDPARRPPSRGPVRRKLAYNRIRWPEELSALFGQISDQELAKRAEVSLVAVVAERRRRGIQPYEPHRPPVEWTPEMIELLGTDTDVHVAAELGLTESSVFYRRHVLGIPAFVNHPRRNPRSHSWTSRELSMLGRMPDQAVANEIGLSSSTVRMKRVKLGIPSFGPSYEPVDWTEERLALLGTRPDREVAEVVGASATTVKNKRRRLGIPAYYEKRAVERTPELVELLKLPTTEVQRRTGLKRDTIRTIRNELGIQLSSSPESRWTPEVVAQLGREPDGVIARDIGLSRNRVSAKRRELGIPAPERSYRRWMPEDLAALGTAPDAEVARRLGRPRHTVTARRLRLGIPPVPHPASLP